MNRKNKHSVHIWEREEWPNFRWNCDALMEPLSRVSGLLGLLQGRMSMQGFDTKSRSQLEALTDELVGSSEIEGISLNADSVRSSIARKLGIDREDGIVADRYVEGLVEVMLDARHNCVMTLSEERLFGWHSALFPTGRSGMYPITVGNWRQGEEPMQVFSGAMGHEKVHYEALPSERVPAEMQKLIEWVNTSDLSPVLMSGVVHLWFVTVHPFDDGNGRLGRTLADMVLARLDEGRNGYFSISAEINRNKKVYYEILEATQKGDADITGWLLWYFGCLESAVRMALDAVERTLQKAVYWERFREVEINERQRKVLNRLWDGFEGKLTTGKWAKICHCSQDTALRDIKDLIDKGMLCAGESGGRSTSYGLTDRKRCFG